MTDLEGDTVTGTSSPTGQPWRWSAQAVSIRPNEGELPFVQTGESRYDSA